MSDKSKEQNIPRHVGIIMDGNRRWAKKHRLAILRGHSWAAQKTIEPLIEAAYNLGIKVVTLWAFSTENWQRGEEEVGGLWEILRQSIKNRLGRLHKKGVRIKIIGDISKLPEDLKRGIEDAIEKTKDNKNITVIFAINYGGRDEILRAIKRTQASKLKAQDLNEAEFNNFLDTKDFPDPDLIIRTGGVTRLSGFLPWQSVYSELYFTDVLFPDFTPQEFSKAIEIYQNRERRFGR